MSVHLVIDMYHFQADILTMQYKDFSQMAFTPSNRRFASHIRTYILAVALLSLTPMYLSQPVYSTVFTFGYVHTESLLSQTYIS